MNSYYRFVSNDSLVEPSFGTLYFDDSVRQTSTVLVLNRPTLKYQDQGDYVTLLQQQLKHLMFYEGAINGIFNDATLKSVKEFQANNNLPITGIVDNNTWSALIYLYAPLAICTTAIYIVQAGDSLWSIAKKYNTTVDELKSLNNLTSNALAIGQRLVVPSTQAGGTSNTTYVVQRGDTLWGIANKFNVSVDNIKTLNNLTSNTLTIGQQLLIPGTKSVTTYTVNRGDTLWSIANKFNVTVDSIKTLNNLTSNLLNIGQVLKIPG